MTLPPNLAAVVEAAVGRPLAEFDPSEAAETATRLRALVDALDASAPASASLAEKLTEAAGLLERGGAPT